MLVRSPTFTNGISSVSVNGSSPDSRISGSTVGTWRGGYFATVSAMTRMCSGVVPQQPPTTLTRPSRAKSSIWAAMNSGLSSYWPKALGRPALG